MSSSPIGHRIRSRRKEIGLTQTALAKKLGISVSYVNLIEHDKRTIGGSLLNRLAEALSLDGSALDGTYERQMLDELQQVAAEPGLADAQLSPDTARDLIARQEPWAKALLAMRRASARDQSLIAALSDRLNNDPLLNSSVYDMLSSSSAIRSVADIYRETDDLSDQERQRFDSILHEEATRLSAVAQTLATAFGSPDTKRDGMTGAEEVDDFLYTRSNWFPDLEDFAEQLNLGSSPDTAILAGHLGRKHRVRLNRVPLKDMPSGAARTSAYDPKTRTLTIAEGIPRSSVRFEIARQIAIMEAEDAIAAQIDGAEELASESGRMRAKRALAAYTAAAIVMPYDPFFENAERDRYDIDALAITFETSPEQLCHRFTTLKKPGAEGVPFAMLRANAAGYLTKRFPLPRLPMPRYGGACPLWAVYSAMQTPDLRVSQIAQFPNGERFFLLARATRPVASAFGQTRPTFTLMLGCEIVHADRLVYSDGLDLSGSGLAEPVGSTCVLCPRETCAHRQEASIRMYKD